MTTMAGNGLLLHALLALRRRLAEGSLSEAEFRRKISKSEFGKIPNWAGENPFDRNYSDFVDSFSDPKPVWNHVKKRVRALEDNQSGKQALAT